MQLKDADIEVHQRGLGEKFEYRVAQNAKIMNMLADSVYSDKILAPIRELSTNAMDGHVKAQNLNSPFDVYLPTINDLNFTIRDYGCGMNREQLTEMYLTYGESDKNNSNDFNGCMGIGSKSPFAYAESFTTTAYHNGKKYVCVNSKDERGIPSLQFLVDGIDTDEPNGIEVSFPVKATDVYNFESKASQLYRYFPVKPNIKRGKVNIAPREYLYEGDNWRIYKDSENSVAIMGWIAYPIEQKHFSNKNDDNYYSWRYDDTTEVQLLNLGIEMDFDIGDVEMDMAREGLQYTTQTKGAINARLQDILDFLKEEMNKSFDSCDSLWDARVRYQELTNGKMGRLQKLFQLQTPTFNGEDITAVISFKGMNGVHIVKFDGRGYKTPKRYDRIDKFWVTNSSSLKKIAFYENDVERGAYAGCQRVITDPSNDTEEVYLIRFDNDSDRKEFIKTMGWKDDSYLNKVSNCPPPPKNGKRGPRESIFEFDMTKASVNRTSVRYAKDWWQPAEIDFTDGGLFVEINSFKCRKASGEECNAVELGKMLKLLETLGVELPEQVVGVKTAVIKKYRKSKDWQDIFKWVRENFKSYLEDEEIEDTLANIQEFDKFPRQDKYEPIMNCGVDLSGTTLEEFTKKISELENINTKEGATCKNAKQLADMLNFNLNGQARYNLFDEEEKLLSKYEMLRILNPWDIMRDKNSNVIARYINLVDSCEGV